MNNDTQTLLNMKKTIEQSKTALARLEGELSGKLKQLKTDFNCSDLAEAERKLVKIDKAIEKDEDTLKQAISKLQEKYDWS
ncbi:MAG TPA: hypothetical protein VMW95_04380 [Desulfobacterales bacterium]|nr:hypothetical protein [Desulfobacterales bacterium]